jgi:hypothetical protein
VVYRDRHVYRLLVVGHIGPVAKDAFADVEVEACNGDTALIGEFDQAALFGALQRILHLRLELIEVTRMRRVASVR